MIDRRTLVSGSVLAAFVPTLRFMPASFETSEPALAGSLVKIDGWSTPGEGNCR